MTVRQDHPNINRNIHPPIVMLVHLLVAFLLNWILPFTLIKPLEWVGYILVVVGLGFAFSAVNQFGNARLDTSIAKTLKQPVYQFMNIPFTITASWYSSDWHEWVNIKGLIE